MTLLDRFAGSTDTHTDEGDEQTTGPGDWGHQRQTNVGNAERLVSVAAGAILTFQGLGRRGLMGLISTAAGAVLIYRGATGHCHAYAAMGIDTAGGGEADAQSIASRRQGISERGFHIEQAFLVNRPADELYRYWRDFTNLPRIMTYLERVDVTDDRRSHWVAKAPRIAGGQVEWDAEITQDEPGSLIAWQSLPGADVDNAGQVRFAAAPGERGTEVHVSMDYVPPAGRVGKWIATLFGENPAGVVREDLRNFKRAMEIGEVLTTAGQPRGTCTGQGTRDAR